MVGNNVSYHLTLKVFVKVTIFKNSCLSDWFLPNFHRNDGTVAINKNVISTDLQNVVQCHHLQNNCISAIIQPILTKVSLEWCYCGWQQMRYISWPWKCRSGSHFIKSNISAIIKPILTTFSSRMMTPILKLSHLCVQSLISLPQITASLHENTPQTSHLFAVHHSSSYRE